jgi:hypothetical protein
MRRAPPSRDHAVSASVAPRATGTLGATLTITTLERGDTMKTTHSALSLKAVLVLASIGLAAPTLGADVTREEREAARAGVAWGERPAQPQTAASCDCSSMHAKDAGK